MSDDAPSNDVLAEQIRADRLERIEFRAEIKDSLARLETQAAKTNGRVTRLEQWRMFLLGGFAALSMPAATKIAQLLTHP
jgi:hypothetical protein